MDNDTGFIGVTTKATQGGITKTAGYQDHHHKYGTEIFHGAKIVSSPEQTNLFLLIIYDYLIWINSVQELPNFPKWVINPLLKQLFYHKKRATQKEQPFSIKLY